MSIDKIVRKYAKNTEEMVEILRYDVPVADELYKRENGYRPIGFTQGRTWDKYRESFIDEYLGQRYKKNIKPIYKPKKTKKTKKTKK